MGGKLATIQNRKQYTMKWVKASQRLPVINKTVIMRFPWHDNTIVLDEGKLKPKEERDNQLWFSTNNYGSIPERENGLEWLDESAESDSGEQVRKLREGLEDCDTLLAHLEDYAHGDGGKMITQQRGKIQQLLTETK